MIRPCEYSILLSDEMGDTDDRVERIYLQRLHQERFVPAVARRGSSVVGFDGASLAYLAGRVAQDVTDDPTRITKEYLREQMMNAVTGDEDSGSLYRYIPPPGVKENPFERLKMPGVVCAGLFSDSPDGSSCVLAVWYQDEFALPIDERVVDQLRGIDWSRYCYDDYYYPTGD